MNRRSFFKSLGLTAASLAVFRCLPETPRGPVIPFLYQKATRIFVVNSEWLSAPYELGVVLPSGRKIADPYPCRFRTLEDGYAFMAWIAGGLDYQVSLEKNKSVVLLPAVC